MTPPRLPDHRLDIIRGMLFGFVLSVALWCVLGVMGWMTYRWLHS